MLKMIELRREGVLGARSHPPLIRRLAQSLTSATILGVLLNWGGQFYGFFVGSGYRAGNGDHEVLSPLGMQWADPRAFQGDWFLSAAPQPHWFFDVVTFIGRASGTLEAVYLGYWAAALLLFGFATVLLAERWAPQRTWLACTGVAILGALSPWLVAGTGTGMISQAIPAVMGGQAAYFFIALVVTNRWAMARAIAPLIAVVHVQQGAVVTVLLVVLTLMQTVRHRRVDVGGVLASIATGGIAAFGLLLRPVAAHPGDFTWVCDELIQWHCAADTWSGWYFYGSVAMILTAALTVFYMRDSQRRLWVATVGLVCLGLLGGMIADRLDVPVLGTIAQSVNVYRLAASIVPFAFWGILLPFLTPMRLRGPVRTAAFFMTWVIVVRIGWGVPLWQFSSHTATMAVITLLALLVQFYKAPRWKEALDRIAGWIVIIGLLINGFSSGFFEVRGLDPSFIPNAQLRAWGQEAGELVPVGEQIIVPPRIGGTIRIATERGVLADCKNIPYGGDALVQWRERLDSLGGWKRQCVRQSISATPQQLAAASEHYDIDYIVLNVDDPTSATPKQLERRGWRVLLAPQKQMPLVLMERE